MTCYSPIQGFVSSAVNEATGKRPIVFSRQGSLSGARQMLPCGRCIGCRLEFSRRWAVRIMHEAKLHKENSFVTLTYEKDTLPEVGSLVPEHLQAFHKRLHNRLLDARGYGIRYYGVGEYGDASCRPHYHSIIFGYDFADKLIYSRSKRDQTLYSSKMLNDVWGKGLCVIGEVNFETAAYVARYCLKKVNGKQREEGHYLVYDADGVIHERVPEFAHMSRRPGVGSGYFDKYGAEIRRHDSLIVNGHEVPSVRYYDLKIDPSELELIKKRRRANSVWLERQVDRRQVRERLTLITSKQKERPL
ncbi:MAG: replication initiator protein [Microvirus sp.]|nr:MAG: replication initiator protein [Microvirus sp.]